MGDGPALAPARVAAVALPVVAHVEQQPAVGGLDELAFVGVDFGRAAQPPTRAVVVAIEDVRNRRRLACDRLTVVARDQQPSGVRAALDLDADAGAGGVPAPAGLLDVGSDVARGRPGLAVIAAGGHQHLVVVAAKRHPHNAA